MDIRADHRPISVRLEARSTPEPNTGCLLWYGSRTKAGYGTLGRGGEDFYVHRLAYVEAHGPIPDGMQVCHKCDTPNCINIDHLFLGSNAENQADMDRKGRRDTKSWTMIGSKHHNARLTDDDIRFIRANCKKRGDQRRMAQQFGITEANVTVIVKRKGWKHVV